MVDNGNCFYPPIEPFRTGRLKVSDLHEIYFEECGNPTGKPVVFLHGGPGAGLVPVYRQAFDPGCYRIVLLDQRGSGQSTPKGELRGNTTWDLVADLEKLREHLGIDCWQVAGGSWGGTLALAYSQTHPEAVTEMIIRGPSLFRKLELDWTHKPGGASNIYPEAWADFISLIPKDEQGDLEAAYYRRLISEDKNIAGKAARAWGAWETALVSLVPDADFMAQHEAVYEQSLSLLECHYSVNRAWIKSDSQLLDGAGSIRHIPCTMIIGRYDLVTPVTIGWELKQRWPELNLVIVPAAGHAFTEPAIAREMVRASDHYANC
ncbi:MAG: prolyl aminopeptidase [bacterium]|nr:prolyl aminopeptidase [Gammaproteobacteria bacterium]HIL95951.1 prolyl aminopeptidase [Pseudomonadales bacterium]